MRRPTAAATKNTKNKKKTNLIFVSFVSFVIFVPPPSAVSVTLRQR